MAETQQTTSPQAKQQQERDGAEPTGVEPGVTEGISAISAEEQAVRAAHQGEGGGAWPPELLERNFLSTGQPADVAALYEQQAEEAKKASKSSKS